MTRRAIMDKFISKTNRFEDFGDFYTSWSSYLNALFEYKYISAKQYNNWLNAVTPGSFQSWVNRNYR